MRSFTEGKIHVFLLHPLRDQIRRNADVRKWSLNRISCRFVSIVARHIKPKKQGSPANEDQQSTKSKIQLKIPWLHISNRSYSDPDPTCYNKKLEKNVNVRLNCMVGVHTRKSKNIVVIPCKEKNAALPPWESQRTRDFLSFGEYTTNYNEWTTAITCSFVRKVYDLGSAKIIMNGVIDYLTIELQTACWLLLFTLLRHVIRWV